MRRTIVLATLLSMLAFCELAAGAKTAVVTDCNTHGQLTTHYSVSELRSAIATMPADVKEYTDCYDVIQRELLAQLGQSNGRGGGSAPAPSSSSSFLPAPLIALLVVLALGGGAFGVLAARRRERRDSGDE